MAINSDEAEEYLAFHLEWDSEPLLSPAKQDRLLLYARAVDANAVSPDGTGYIPTWSYDSLHVAIHIGWQWKLASAVELHEEDEDEIYEHCKERVAYWGGIVAGIAIGGTTSTAASGSFAIPNIAVF